jgi:hemerythrin
MCDDDLPDHDYASIYGHTALHARIIAEMRALVRRQEAIKKELAKLLKRSQRWRTKDIPGPEKEDPHAPRE